jgi:hypothetical protein
MLFAIMKLVFPLPTFSEILINLQPDFFLTKFQSVCVFSFFLFSLFLLASRYARLSPEVLIDRLINRHQHLLAFRLAEYLGMKPDRILVHWACSKVKKADLDDKIVCSQIVAKLGNQKGISYAEVAKTAYKVGRPELATQLLDYEPRAADQVPLLISMQEDERALVKAIESGDTDLGNLAFSPFSLPFFHVFFLSSFFLSDWQFTSLSHT